MTTPDSKSKVSSAIYEQAADWIVDLREGEVDAATREKLDAWFRESPQHIRAYLELSSIWEEGADPDLDRAHTTESLIAFVRTSSNVIALNGLGAKMGGQSETFTEHGVALFTTEQPTASPASADAGVPGRRRAWRRVWPPAAAVACAIVALSLCIYDARNVMFATETGEQRFEKLIDGSTIELNSKSRVRVRFSERERNVDLLEGQALFHVAKDASRPFIVHSDSTLVRAVGTQFDVYRKTTGTVVTVVEGRVAVLSPWLAATSSSTAGSTTQGPADISVSRGHAASTPDGSPESSGVQATDTLLSHASGQSGAAVFLSAGEQVSVGAGDAAPRPTHTDTAVVTAWTQHELVFEATPLTDVAQEFNRYNTRRLVVDDPALEKIHITGMFSSADPSALIKFLRTQRDLVVLESDRSIRIVKR